MMNRKELQQLHETAKQEAETRIIQAWSRDIVDAVTNKAKLGLKAHTVQHWRGGDLTLLRKERLIASLRQHFADDVDVRIVDVPSSQPMLIIDWS